MAEFIIEKLKWGYEDEKMDEHVCITNVIFSPDDEIVYLPEKYNGELVTHVGYTQNYTPAHEHWCDWHHPSKGSEWVKGKYTLGFTRFTIPENVKKIIIPASVKDFNSYSVKNAPNVILEVDESNDTYTVKNNKVVHK